jgi:hypothetical protein
MAQAAIARRQSASARIAAHRAADDATMQSMLQGAMRRAGQ